MHRCKDGSEGERWQGGSLGIQISMKYKDLGVMVEHSAATYDQAKHVQ
jgi:hypothetical protein